ncbi:MAG: CSLREA domain-containing protein [Chloroflexi bacterium]|nr:CSLREA domain-containing protein [Chloroflexota bacterium]
MTHSLRLTLIASLLVSLLFTIAPVPRAYAAAYVVNSLADNTTDDAFCTLREAINAANNTGGSNTNCGALSNADDTITFSVSGTITLGGTQLPTIGLGNGTLTINGGGTITISGNNTSRIFRNSGNLTLQNLTIANGNANNEGGGAHNNFGTLTISNSTFSNNTASNDAGAVQNQGGTLTISNSTFINNTSPTATNGGGAINNVGTATISNSTFSGNSSTNGGGVRSSTTAALTIINSTFSGNTATGNGGAIRNNFTGLVTLKNTIVNGTNNCSGTITDGGNNLDSANTCGFTTNAKINTDPNLGALAGSPQYFPLNSGSAAIDAGDNTICAAAPVNNTSQNGVTRPADGDGNGTATCDIGSYEAQFSDLTAAKTNNVGGTVTLGNSFNWTATISNTGAGAAAFTDGQVIFRDNLPAGPTYGTPTVQNVTNVTNSANIVCAIAANVLTCTASGATVTLGATTGRFDVVFSATPATTGALTNPTGGVCRADPDGAVTESSEANNDCTADTVTVNAAPGGGPNPNFIGSGVTGANGLLWINELNVNVFQDHNRNGKDDDGSPLAGIKINVTGTTFCVVVPEGWEATTPTCVDVATTGGYRVGFGLVPKQTTTGGTSGVAGQSASSANLAAQTATMSRAGGALADSLSGVSVGVPNDAVPDGTTLTIQPLAQNNAPALPFGYRFIGSRLADITARDGGGNLLTDFNAHPLTVCFTYTVADLLSAGGSVANLQIQSLSGGGPWSVESGARRVDAASQQICVDVTHLSTYGLTAKKPLALPATGAPIGAMLGALLLAVLAAIAVTGWLVARRRRSAS